MAVGLRSVDAVASVRTANLSNTILVIDSQRGPYFECVARCIKRLECALRRSRGPYDALRYLAKTQGTPEAAPLAVVINANARSSLAIAERVHHLTPFIHILFVADEEMGTKLSLRLHDGAIWQNMRWSISPPTSDLLYESLSHALRGTCSCKSEVGADSISPPVLVMGEHLGFAITEILPYMVWSAQADGVVDYYNRRWCLFTGVSRAELLRLGWMTFIHPDDRPFVQASWEHALESGDPPDTEARMRAQNGEWQWHRIQAERERTEEGLGRWFGTCIILYDRKGIEGSWQFLSEVACRVTESLDYESTLVNLAQVAVPRFADWCAVDVVNADGRLERLSVAHADPVMAKRIAAHRPDTEVAQLTAADVARTGEMQLVTHVNQALIDAVVHNPAQRRFFALLALRSLLRLPLRVGGRTVGVISFALSGLGT